MWVKQGKLTRICHDYKSFFLKVLFCCACAVMQRRQWSTQQMPSLQLATCASPRCTLRAKTAWVELLMESTSVTCFTNKISAVWCWINHFRNKSLSRRKVDYYKTTLRAKQIQEQNLLVSDNFVEQKRNTALRGRVQTNLQRASLSLALPLSPTLSLSVSPFIPRSLL